MSWDSYIDNLIAQSKDASGQCHASKVAIISIEDGTLWTSRTHQCALQITPQEGKTIAEVFKNRNFQPFITNGLVLESKGYMFLREVDGHIVYAKLKGGSGNSCIISLFATKRAIVIGHASEGSQAGMLNKAVAVIGEYMVSQNM